MSDFDTFGDFAAYLDKHGIGVYAYAVLGADIRIERRSKMDVDDPIWAVVQGRSCLNTDLEWEYEANPSNRTDDFISRTRFRLMDAFKLLERKRAQGL